MSSTLSESLLLLLLILCFRYSFSCSVMVHTTTAVAAQDNFANMRPAHRLTRTTYGTLTLSNDLFFYQFCCCAPERNNSVLTNIYFVFDFFSCLFSFGSTMRDNCANRQHVHLLWAIERRRPRPRLPHTKPNEFHRFFSFHCCFALVWCALLCVAMKFV